MFQDNTTTTPHWYVVHTYSGYENKVATNLEKIVENRKMGHLIQSVKIPMETVVDPNDENAKTERKLLPRVLQYSRLGVTEASTKPFKMRLRTGSASFKALLEQERPRPSSISWRIYCWMRRQWRLSQTTIPLLKM